MFKVVILRGLSVDRDIQAVPSSPLLNSVSRKRSVPPFFFHVIIPLTRDQRTVLKELRGLEDEVILPADKGDKEMRL